jgi:hypothetical protein
MPRRSWDLHTAAAVIITATVGLSFDTLHQLARLCGFDTLAWAWPVCLDAVAYLGTRLWLARGPAYRFARGLALVAIGLSIVGNGLDHGLTHTGTPPDLWIVIAVGSVPPVMLALVIHALVANRTGTTVRPGSAVPADQTVPAAAAAPVPVDQPAAAVPPPGTNPVPAPVPPAVPVREPDRTGTDQQKPTVPVRTVHSVQSSDVDLMDKLHALATELGKRPSVHATRAALGVGTTRATRLLDQYDREPDRVPTGPVQTGLHLVPVQPARN